MKASIIRKIHAIKQRGARVVARRAWVRLARKFGYDLSDPYLDWIEDHTPGRRRAGTPSGAGPERENGLPRIGLLILTDDRDSHGLDRTLRSLRRQTYRRWTHWTIAGVTKKTVGEDPADLDCDYLGIMSAGDCLSPEALYELPACSSTPPRPRRGLLRRGSSRRERQHRTAPVFKPACSPEMLLGYHYTGRLTLARRGPDRGGGRP